MEKTMPIKRSAAIALMTYLLSLNLSYANQNCQIAEEQLNQINESIRQAKVDQENMRSYENDTRNIPKSETERQQYEMQKYKLQRQQLQLKQQRNQLKSIIKNCKNTGDLVDTSD